MILIDCNYRGESLFVSNIATVREHGIKSSFLSVSTHCGRLAG